MIKKVRNYITRKKIEKALGFKLLKWQVSYIFGGKNIILSQRACGKTLAHQLKLLLDYKAPPLYIKPYSAFLKYTDHPFGTLKYAKWYAEELYNLYIKLIDGGVRVRQVILFR